MILFKGKADSFSWPDGYLGHPSRAYRISDTHLNPRSDLVLQRWFRAVVELVGDFGEN